MLVAGRVGAELLAQRTDGGMMQDLLQISYERCLRLEYPAPRCSRPLHWFS